jgi:undecaprenyl-diphosphatase
MDIFSAIILAVVQGITEFLPISSSGHLVLVREFLTINETNALAFDAVLHLATTLAIITYFWTDIWVLVQTALRKLGRLPVNEKDVILLYALLIGTVPAAILGVFLEPIMTEYLHSALIVAVFLLVAALFFAYAEWRYYQNPARGSLTVRSGFLVGCFQALALLPGFSRSGATLAGGMLLGLSRIESARFSFLLAIPITLAVGAKKLLDLIIMGGEVNWAPILTGAVVTYFIALLVAHYFLVFIRKYTLWPFIWYSVILSIVVAYYFLYV